MLTVYAALVVWLAIWASLIREEGWPDDAVSWVLGGMICVASGLFFAAVGFAAMSGIGWMLPTEKDKQPSHVAKLASLRSSDGVQGSFRGGFFLGIGSIGSQLYYFWYEEAGAGVTPRQLAAGVGTYVYETNRNDAELRVYDWHFKRAWWGWFAVEGPGQTWEFHVPKGTIREGYSL